MIAAGFLPTCAAAWHLAAHALVASGWWTDVPFAGVLPAPVWFAVPAAIATTAAILTASASSASFAVIVGASAFVHPWLPIVLAPLLAACTDWSHPTRWWRGLVFGSALAALAVVLATECVGGQARTAWPALSSMAVAAVGLPGLMLIGFDAVLGRARRAQAAAGAVALVAVVCAIAGIVDGSTALGALAPVLWWRAVAGARHVIDGGATVLARAGAVALVLLVPVLACGTLVPPASPSASIAARAVWQALDDAPMPASIVSTGGAEDVSALLWRAADPGGRPLAIVAPPDVAVSLTGTPLLTWTPSAREMELRGFGMEPVTAADTAAVLWRATDVVPCVTLRASWSDVTQQASAGRFAGVFPAVAPLRGILVYATGDTPLSPFPDGWPPGAADGFIVRAFDLEDETARTELDEAMARDEFDAAAVALARYVVRVRVDRNAAAPESLRVELGAPARGAWARRYVPDDTGPERRPSVCRATR
ncbi:MAG: hypothetical protein R2712_08040 [Vicinamibacterales bacterium]